jgi:hypothetical protein
MVKKILNVSLSILLGIILVLAFVLSLAFIFIEGRLLFAGDFLVYDNVFNGFIRYFFRLLIALGAASLVVFEFINMFSKVKKYKYYIYAGDVSLAIAGVVALLTTTNYAGLAIFGVSILVLIIKTILVYFVQKH